MKKISGLFIILIFIAVVLTACGGVTADDPAAAPTEAGTTTEKTVATQVISSPTATITQPIYDGDIPADAILLVVTDADGTPIADADVSCGMPPDEDGDVQAITELVGATDENGCVLWKPTEWGERAVTVTWQGKVIYDEDIDIQADDCGDRILLQAA